MANFETSFIPEQGGSYQGGSRRSVVATVFSIIITLIAIGLSVGAWWLNKQEETKVKDLQVNLDNMEAGLKIDKIEKLDALDKRIKLANVMFNKHPMPSMLIDYLAENTVSTVKWKSISYTRGVLSDSAGDVLDLSGEGLGYDSLLQQLTQFRKFSNQITKVELKSYHIDPRTNIVAIQMGLTINPNYATFSTYRLKHEASEKALGNVTPPESQNVLTTMPAIPIPTPSPVKPNVSTSSKLQAAITTP